jgi:hypothetical protein
MQNTGQVPNAFWFVMDAYASGHSGDQPVVPVVEQKT